MEMEATTFQKRRRLTSSSTMVMHKQSKTITKSKPKIRIVHLFTPEIIPTTVSNFREVVQKLTGKTDHGDQLIHNQKPHPRSRGSHDHHHHHHHQAHDMKKSHGFTTMEKPRELDGLFINSQVVQEEEMMTWKGGNVGGEMSSGGFLNGLGYFDGFLQEIGEFPYLPFTVDPTVASSSSSHFHGGVLAESHQFA